MIDALTFGMKHTFCHKCFFTFSEMIQCVVASAVIKGFSAKCMVTTLYWASLSGQALEVA